MKKFVSPEPPPTAHEAEILDILGEECAEIAIELSAILARIQVRTSKIKRFGVNEVQPGQGLTNAERLSDEIGDLLAVIDLAHSAGLTKIMRIQNAKAAKYKKLERFMQTVPNC